MRDYGVMTIGDMPLRVRSWILSVHVNGPFSDPASYMAMPKEYVPQDGNHCRLRLLCEADDVVHTMTLHTNYYLRDGLFGKMHQSLQNREERRDGGC